MQVAGLLRCMFILRSLLCGAPVFFDFACMSTWTYGGTNGIFNPNGQITKFGTVLSRVLSWWNTMEVITMKLLRYDPKQLVVWTTSQIWYEGGEVAMLMMQRSFYLCLCNTQMSSACMTLLSCWMCWWFWRWRRWRRNIGWWIESLLNSSTLANNSQVPSTEL